jgi:cytochrome c553
MGIVWQHWRPPVLGLAASLFFAGAAFAQTPTPAERIQTCGACHGEDGNSKIENIPSIAGQPDFFILNQLVLMRERVRPVEAMAEVVKDLKDEDITAIAAHFSKLEPKASDEKIDPALVQRGTQIANQKRCVSCHGATLEGAQQVPRIARQRVDYLIKSLKEFRDGTRPGADTIMSQPVAGLSDADLAALAHYAAGK